MTKERKHDAKDRISQLPDEVLCHILSFLPTNEVIATCLLSTRWRSLWTLVPALDFECTPPITILKTQERIDKFLSLRRTQSITRFRLKCNEMHEHSSYSINELVSTAIAEKVEQINISLCPCNPNVFFFFSVSITLFTCTTIVTLKLKGPFVLDVPSSVYLPSLKNMHLDVEKCHPSFKPLLSGSPVLQVFYLKHKWALWFNQWKIVRNSRGNLLVASKPFLDLVIQSDGGYDFIHDYSVGHWENMVKVKVYMTVHDLDEEIPNVHLYPYVVRLLKMLRNVECLSLCDLTEKMKGPSTLDLPQFQNLVQLDLCLGSVDSLFLKLPEKCPKLQVLEFNVKDQN